MMYRFADDVWWGSASPLCVGGRLRRNLAAKAFSRAFYSG